MEFAADGATPATGGEVTLFIDDRPVGKGRMDHTVPVRFSGYAGMDIGRDNGGVVDLSYESQKPFAFTGTVKKVVFDIKPHLSDQDELDLHAAAHHGQPRTACRHDQSRQEESMAFDDETTDVLIGGYLSTDAAHEDYEAVRSAARASWGAVVVSKDLEGNLAWSRPTTWSRKAPRVSAGSASWSGCSRRHCSPRPRSAGPSARSAARRCTRRSAARSRRWPVRRFLSAVPD